MFYQQKPNEFLSSVDALTKKSKKGSMVKKVGIVTVAGVSLFASLAGASYVWNRDAFDSAMDKIKTDVGNFVNTVTGEIEGLNGQIETLTNEKADLQTQLDGKIAELAQAQTDYDNLLAEKNALQAKYDALVTSSGEEATELQGQIDDLNAQLTEANNTITTLTNEKATLEARITELESQVADLEAQLAQEKDLNEYLTELVNGMNADSVTTSNEVAEMLDVEEVLPDYVTPTAPDTPEVNEPEAPDAGEATEPEVSIFDNATTITAKNNEGSQTLANDNTMYLVNEKVYVQHSSDNLLTIWNAETGEEIYKQYQEPPVTVLKASGILKVQVDSEAVYKEYIG